MFEGFRFKVINPDLERKIHIPKFPYKKNGNLKINLSSDEDLVKRDQALQKISEEMPEIYNTWMLEDDHELKFAFTPMIYQPFTYQENEENEENDENEENEENEKNDENEENEENEKCYICKNSDNQLLCYTFPYHCRPHRKNDYWDTLHINVCFSCYFLGGQSFPTWSRGRDYWDAIDVWDVTIEKTIRPIFNLLIETCDNYTKGNIVSSDFDPKWINYLKKPEIRDEYQKYSLDGFRLFEHEYEYEHEH